MPRANRHIVPGHIYHVTHRCHDRDFLLKFARDRDVYRSMLRAGLKREGVSLLGYTLTCNHTHLLLTAPHALALSRMMQSVEGEFAQYYNNRKKRSGAFRADRYHATMIDSGRHLWACLRYIDLNMVRAGAVDHPERWEWGGYRELMGLRKRYCLLDIGRVVSMTEAGTIERLRSNHAATIQEMIDRRALQRNPAWSEGVAVGSRTFVADLEPAIRNRYVIQRTALDAATWILRETGQDYGAFSALKTACKGPDEH